METLSPRDFGTATACMATLAKRWDKHDDYYRPYIHELDENDEEQVFCARTDGVGDRIRRAREAKGLSIRQCAHVIEPSRINNYIGEWQSWEDGDVTPTNELWPTLEALLGVPIAQLICGGSEISLAKQWISERLESFEPDAELQPDRNLSYLCQRIKRLREQTGLTIAECAAGANKVLQRYPEHSDDSIDAETWALYENGYPPLAIHGIIIAKYFGMDVERLALPTAREAT